MKRTVLSFIAGLAVFAVTQAACPDFMDLHSANVKAYTGNTSNPFASQGVVGGRHTLITTQGTDPNTGGALQLLPPGESMVIRLGNAQIDAEAEALVYRFTVDKDKAVLLLKFAVVLEDPEHGTMDQPRFTVRVTDSNGNLTEECAEYDVSARAGIPDFQTYQNSSRGVARWRDWASVGLDLSHLIGQEVQVQVITRDCAQSAHFGYAYFAARCMPNLLQLENCNGSTPFQVSAPDYFASYLWDNGDQTRTTTRTNINSGGMWCTVTSVTGCQFTLRGYVTTESVSTQEFIQATICEGERYNENYFNLPAQNPGVHKYYNTVINPATCDDSKTTELELTVIQRYNHIKTAICHGENYTANGFNIMQPAPGVRHDTLKTGSTGDCDKYNVLELTVSVNFDMPNSIVGDATPCSNELVTYAFSGSETLTKFAWEFPDNAVVIKGRYSPQVTLYYKDDTPATIILKGENGCGTGATPLSVHPHKTHRIQLNEQVCQGEGYSNYGFNLGVQNNLGFFVYEKHLTSSFGCDSSVVLALNVLPVPVVRIEPADAVLCNAGDEISLFAVTGDMEWEEEDDGDAEYAVAFIYDCGLSYRWNTGDISGSITKKPTETTTYTVTVTSESGCSATASQAVVVNTLAPVIVHDTVCAGETYTEYGFNATTTGAYNTTIHNDDCDIPLTVHLLVRQPITRKITGSVCAGERFTEHGFDIALYQEGMFRDTLHFISRTGCDSTVTLEITVRPAPEITVHDTVCQYQPYNKNGFNLPVQNIAGEFTHTRIEIPMILPYPPPCNSAITLKLTVNPVITNIISDEVQRDSAYNRYNFNFPKVTKDTTATWNLKSSRGCDSTVVLHLKTNCVNDTVSIADNIFIGKDYTKNGFTIPVQTTIGTVFDTLRLQNKYACDSIVILNLKVLCTLSDTTKIVDAIFVGENYSKNGFTIPVQTTVGTVFDTLRLKNQFLCDSTVILELKVQCVNNTTHITATICSNESYFFNGNNYNETGIYADTLQTSFGCDSIITLKLTVNKSFTVFDTIVLYEHDLPFTYLNTTFSAGSHSGDYVFPRTTTNGCDSIINLNLTIYQIVWQTICENELPLTIRDTLFLQETQSGVYVVDNGSTTLILTVYPAPPPPIIAPKTMCEGALTPLQAFGSGLIQWISADKKLPDWSGETYDFHRLGQSDIPLGVYEFELYDIDVVSGCESERVQFSFEITPAANPTITGRTEFCLQAIEEMYAIETAAQGSNYFWKTSGNQYNYSKDGNPYSPNRYVDWYGVGIDTVYVYERTPAGCEGFDTLVVKIADYPTARYTWALPGASSTIEFTDSSYQAPIIAQNPNGTQVEIPLTYTMEWFFDTNNNRDTAVVDMFVEYHDRFKPIQIHDYTYGFKYPILTVTNDYGCRARYVTEIFVDVPNGIYIPNAFSPSNAAASVRVFKPVAYNLEYCNVWIYDKWGNLLWYGNRVEHGIFVDEWNGTYNGELLQSDVYIWKIEAKFRNGTTWAGQKKPIGGYSKFGSVVLVR